MFFRFALFALVVNSAVGVLAAPMPFSMERTVEQRDGSLSLGLITAYAKRTPNKLARAPQPAEAPNDSIATKAEDGGVPTPYKRAEAPPDSIATKSEDGSVPVAYKRAEAPPDSIATKSDGGGVPIVYNGRRWFEKIVARGSKVIKAN